MVESAERGILSGATEQMRNVFLCHDAASLSRHAIAILVTLAISGTYLWSFAFLGWLPQDDGLLGHCAERVLQGELPHRDFADAYSGGLSFLHALAFRTLGTSLSSLRIVLFIATLMWVPLCYGIAARFAPPVGAAVLTLTCVAWGPPNYFASLPSWYNLYLATAGTLCLFVFFERNQLRWLILAGLCGGISITIKIIGLYWIAAAVLAIWFHDQVISRPVEKKHARSISMLILTILVALPVPLILVGLTRHRLGIMEFAHFVLPGLLLSLIVITAEIQRADGDLVSRLKRLTAEFIALGFGAFTPLCLLSVPYLLTGSLGVLWHGVFVLPRLRINNAAQPMLPAFNLIFTLPVIVLGIVGWMRPIRAENRQGIWLLVQIGAACCLYASMSLQIGYHAVWSAAANMLPAICVLTAIQYWIIPIIDGRSASRLFAVIASAGLVSLVQFPFSAPIYFCYAAPVLILALFAIFARQPEGIRPVHWIGLLLFLFAVVFRFSDNPLGFRFGVLSKSAPPVFWSNPRVLLWVSSQDQAQYSRIQTLIQRHVPRGRPIYAAPDCPEVYYLSERRNPTPTMYDFFDEPSGRASRLIRMLDEQQIPLVLINREPLFSSQVNRQLLSAIRKQYSQKETVGKFIVFWGRHK
jgi:hypothetical protein